MFYTCLSFCSQGHKCKQTPPGQTPPSRHPLGRQPPGQTPPEQTHPLRHTPKMATAADSAHPTGMHSCYHCSCSPLKVLLSLHEIYK